MNEKNEETIYFVEQTITETGAWLRRNGDYDNAIEAMHVAERVLRAQGLAVRVRVVEENRRILMTSNSAKETLANGDIWEE